MSGNTIADVIRGEAAWQTLAQWARARADEVEFGPGEARKATRDLGWVRSFIWGSVSFLDIEAQLAEQKYTASPLQQPKNRGGHGNQQRAEVSPVRQPVQDFVGRLRPKADEAGEKGPPRTHALKRQIDPLNDDQRLALLREFVEALHEKMVARKA